MFCMIFYRHHQLHRSITAFVNVLLQLYDLLFRIFIRACVICDVHCLLFIAQIFFGLIGALCLSTVQQ